MKSQHYVWLIAVMLLTFGSNAKTLVIKPDTKAGKYYQVVFVWVKDPAKYQEYATKVGPVVGKYGGMAERILSPVTSYYGGSMGENLKQPHMINIVYYDSKKAYEQFEKDPDFLRLKSLRAEAIDMAGIGGSMVGKDLVDGSGVKNRLYMVEMVNYKDGSDKLYKKYQEKAKALYSRHGQKKERSIKPDMIFGNIKRTPDLVNIMYLENESKKEAMQKDPTHKAIEDAYANAIADLIWIEGKAMTF